MARFYFLIKRLREDVTCTYIVPNAILYLHYLFITLFLRNTNISNKCYIKYLEFYLK